MRLFLGLNSAIFGHKNILTRRVGCYQDDALAMDFVTAAANLRSYVFGIEQKFVSYVFIILLV